jgi:Icc-related predicted phosphoesterase
MLKSTIEVLMKLVFLSDTHSKHRAVENISGDIVIHCGDFTRRGKNSEIIEFLDWFSSLDFKYHILVAGNHDFGLEDSGVFDYSKILKDKGVIYLEDSGVNINGLNFWGSPYQPEFNNWAFNLKRGEELKKHWDMIPDDTDILITHGPPHKILDLCPSGNVGCEELLKRVSSLNLKIHAFGHIHEGYGSRDIDGTYFINCSILDEYYRIKNKPVVIEL